MRKFFQSGAAFIVVALVCFAAGVASENGPTFIALGGFWMIMAIIVRGKNLKKPPTGNDDAAG